MDFVQRNLINERNNLQVELAKAKLLIAQLSEDLQTPGRAKEVAAEIKRRENKGDPVKGLKRLDRDEKGDMGTLIGRGGKETPAITKTGIMLGGVGPDGEMVKRNKLASHGGRGGRSVGIGKGEDSPQNMSEQAEYISDLENVIISIAEQLGVHPNDLLDEGILGNVVAKVKNVLGIKSPDQRRTAQGLMTTQQLADYHKKQDTEAAEHNSPENRARREAQTAAMERSRKYQAEKASEPRPLKLDHMGRKMTQASSDMAYTDERIGHRPDHHL